VFRLLDDCSVLIRTTTAPAFATAAPDQALTVPPTIISAERVEALRLRQGGRLWTNHDGEDGTMWSFLCRRALRIPSFSGFQTLTMAVAHQPASGSGQLPATMLRLFPGGNGFEADG